MDQPNCYWTLTTPLFTVVGLYTNVPSGGDVREPQISWFANELAAAPTDKHLIVALHHPVHSVAEGSHQGSEAMEKLLESACRHANRVPKLVLTGHVHNYQRFTTTFLGKPCTFVVAGMGGHAMDKLPGTLRGKTTTNLPIQHSYPVNLDLATDQYVGFLRVSATAAHLDCEFLSTSQTLPIDSFRL